MSDDGSKVMRTLKRTQEFTIHLERSDRQVNTALKHAEVQHVQGVLLKMETVDLGIDIKTEKLSECSESDSQNIPSDTEDQEFAPSGEASPPRIDLSINSEYDGNELEQNFLKPQSTDVVSNICVEDSRIQEFKAKKRDNAPTTDLTIKGELENRKNVSSSQSFPGPHCQTDYLDDHVVQIPETNSGSCVDNLETKASDRNAINERVEEKFIIGYVFNDCGVISFSCAVCSTFFSSSESLLLHNTGHKKEYISYVPLVDNSPENVINQDVSQLFSCSVCSRTFKRQCYLANHNRVHYRKPFLCVKCKNSFASERILKQHITKHTEKTSNLKKHIAVQSNFPTSYPRESFLMQPIDTANGKALPCSLCSASFIRKHELLKHIKIHHKEKYFFCSICNRSFASKDTLKIHVKSHINEKPYSCSACNRLFAHKQVLKTHIMIHSGEKPFTCLVCSKPFRRRHHLNKHLEIHNHKPFSCSTCSRMFNNKIALEKHINGHSDDKHFSCSVCNRKFFTEGGLECHYIIHDETSVCCSICARSFRTKNGLRQHMKIHSSERETFSCSVCSKSFTLKGNLKKHVLRHVDKINDFY